MPGMYAVTSMPEVSRTRATLRSAELGFFGVVVKTRVHTPRRCGEPLRAGVLVFSAFDSRPLRTSWAIVGTRFFPLRFSALEFRASSRSGARRGARNRRISVAGHGSGPQVGPDTEHQSPA